MVTATTIESPTPHLAEPAGAERAATESVAAIVGELRRLLGDWLTAVIAGVTEVQVLDDWMHGDGAPDAAAEARLRTAHEVASFIATVDPPSIIQMWFIGMNPELDFRAPAQVIGEDPTRVLDAAYVFVANG